jgi:TolB-like protein
MSIASGRTSNDGRHGMHSLGTVLTRLRSSLTWVVTSSLLLACRGPATGRPSPVVADSAIAAAIANERALDPSSFPARSIGVAPLGVSAVDTTLSALGYGLADLLITDLARSRQLTVVDRVRVDALLREVRFSSTGRVDSTNAPRAGRLIGARQLLLGSIVALPDSQFRIDARLADAQTSALAEPIVGVAPLARILDAEKQLAYRIFDRMGVTLTPAERAMIEQRPTQSIGALLAYSRAVRDEALGNYGAAARHYQNAMQLDPSFDYARRRMTDVQTRASGSRTATTDRQRQRSRITALALDGINRPNTALTSDAADAAFRNAQTTTLIIVVNIP